MERHQVGHILIAILPGRSLLVKCPLNELIRSQVSVAAVRNHWSIIQQHSRGGTTWAHSATPPARGSGNFAVSAVPRPSDRDHLRGRRGQIDQWRFTKAGGQRVALWFNRTAAPSGLGVPPAASGGGRNAWAGGRPAGGPAAAPAASPH